MKAAVVSFALFCVLGMPFSLYGNDYKTTTDLGALAANTRTRCLESSGVDRVRCWNELHEVLQAIQKEIFSDLQSIDNQIMERPNSN